jgi:DNA-binding beta-propeller fold protein YncE
MTRSRWARLGILAATAGLHLRCGSDQASQPTPTPTPVTTRAFIYVLSPGTLSAFEVVPTSGLPVPVGSLAITYADHVAIDPHGHFVYVSGWDRQAHKGFLRSYVVDAGDASLRLASEHTASTSARLVAGEDYLVVIEPSGMHRSAHVTTYAVDAQGALQKIEARYGHSFYESTVWWLPGVGPARDLASYVVEDHSYSDPASGIFTVRVGRAGIESVGRDTIPDGIDYIESAVSLGGNIVVADRETGGLSVLAVDPTDGRVSVRSRAPGTGSSCRLAAAPSGDRLAVLTDESLSLYSLLANGELAETDQLPVSSFWDRSMAFHPSGSFLYAALSKGLLAFAIGAEGKLSEFAGPFAPRGEVVAGLPPY